MIVNIKGIIKNKRPESVVIETSGLSYLCFISNNTYDSLPNIGKEVSLNTYFHVNDNCQQLFGFENIAEKELFMMLISVSGIGPKTGIALLSAVTADEARRPIVTERQSVRVRPHQCIPDAAREGARTQGAYAGYP